MGPHKRIPKHGVFPQVGVPFFGGSSVKACGILVRDNPTEPRDILGLYISRIGQTIGQDNQKITGHLATKIFHDLSRLNHKRSALRLQEA